MHFQTKRIIFDLKNDKQNNRLTFGTLGRTRKYVKVFLKPNIYFSFSAFIFLNKIYSKNFSFIENLAAKTIVANCLSKFAHTYKNNAANFFDPLRAAFLIFCAFVKTFFSASRLYHAKALPRSFELDNNLREADSQQKKRFIDIKLAYQLLQLIS